MFSKRLVYLWINGICLFIYIPRKAVLPHRMCKNKLRFCKYVLWRIILSDLRKANSMWSNGSWFVFCIILARSNYNYCSADCIVKQTFFPWINTTLLEVIVIMYPLFASEKVKLYSTYFVENTELFSVYYVTALNIRGKVLKKPSKPNQTKKKPQAPTYSPISKQTHVALRLVFSTD